MMHVNSYDHLMCILKFMDRPSLIDHDPPPPTTTWPVVSVIFLDMHQFTKLEIQVVYISRDMSILMSSLERKIGPFGDFEGSNLKIES